MEEHATYDARGDRVYYCDCPRYCKTRRLVARRTYYEHRQQRAQDAQSSVPPPPAQGPRAPPPVRVSSSSSSATRGGSPRASGDAQSRARPPQGPPPARVPAPPPTDFPPEDFADDLLGPLPPVLPPRNPDSTLQLPPVPPYVLDPQADLPFEDPADAPPFGATEDTGAPSRGSLEEARLADAFIAALKAATLDTCGFDADTLARIRDPPQSVPTLDPDLRLSLRLFLATGNASEESYAAVREGIMERDPGIKVLSYEALQRQLAVLTGVVPLVDDMCTNSCMAYTGPFATRTRCPYCREERYDQRILERSGGKKRVPRRTTYTFPIITQLQALYRSPESARALHYRRDATRALRAELAAGRIPPSYDDYLSGEDYLAAVNTGRIKDTDSLLMLSVDGAQVYERKTSDTWVAAWMFPDASPLVRYGKNLVHPATLIGGPKKPKHLDSFTFRSLCVLVAAMKEGIKIWDAFARETFVSNLFFLFATADTPGMAYLSGLVGHNGRIGCRIYCALPGRNKPGGSHYYPAMLQPTAGRGLPIGQQHGDVTFEILDGFEQQASRAARYWANLQDVRSQTTAASYAAARLRTGISKPCVFLSIPRSLGVPDCLPADLMHLLCLNIPDLIIPLLRGSFDCFEPDTPEQWPWAVLRDLDAWTAHGALVAGATHYLPSSFGRPPRNPAEKINSGYKAWEYLLYVYGLFPGLLRHLLPLPYYTHLCKLIFAARIVLQRTIPRAHIPLAHIALREFVRDFELYYYARRIERVHFVRQSIHSLTHIVPEIYRNGPGALYTQWTLETFIGSLGAELRQHAAPYAALAEKCLRRSQVNSLFAMFPALRRERGLPSGAEPLGDGYVLLPASARGFAGIPADEVAAVRAYLQEQRVTGYWDERVIRWARLGLPNGQIARSAWKEEETEARAKNCRRARMVKIRGDRFAEVRYFFKMDYIREGRNVTRTLAMVCAFSPPDAELRQESYGTLMACTYLGRPALRVVPVKSIDAVVAMVPLPCSRAEAAGPGGLERYAQRYFVVEKPGLSVATLAGLADDPEDEDGNDDIRDGF